MKKLVVMTAAVSAIAAMIGASDASAQSWGRRGANVRCTNGGVVQGEMVLQSQTRTSRRVEQLPLNGAVQTAARHARNVGRVLISSDCSAIAGCRKRPKSKASGTPPRKRKTPRGAGL